MPKVINMPMLQSFIDNTMVMSQPKPIFAKSPLKPEYSHDSEKRGFQSALFLTPIKGKHYLDYIFNNSSSKQNLKRKICNPYVSPDKLPSISPLLRKINQDLLF
jgi:hypothetical protein